jgi:hypothetical protein
LARRKASHHGAARHVEKQELEVRQFNLKTSANIVSSTTGSGGRVRHDDRGNAVWDYSLDTGEFDALSSSGLIRHLDIADLKMQGSPGFSPPIAGRDAGGGGDPYNFRGADSRAPAQRRSRVR